MSGLFLTRCLHAYGCRSACRKQNRRWFVLLGLVHSRPGIPFSFVSTVHAGRFGGTLSGEVQDSLIKIKDTGDSKADSCEKGMGIAVIRVVIRRRSLSLLNVFSIRCRCLYGVLSKGNASFPVFRDDMQTVLWLLEIRQSRCVIPSVCWKRTVIGEEMLEDGRTLVVADLSLSQQKQDVTPMPVTDDMEFGIQAAFCPPYTTWRIPFLSRLAAVR